MHTNLETLFNHIWQDYISVTPSANKVHKLLCNGVELINDHVAFRTFNIAKVNLDKLAVHFIALGYEEKDQYIFEQKKLRAKHFEHPDTTKPKVFISELLVEKLSADAQNIIHNLVNQIDENTVSLDNFLYSGAQWKVSSEDYQTLLLESEYAAWMSAWGYRANHFTVSVNHLAGFENLTQVNQTLKKAGFTLNASGGEIKGGSDVYLAQSSTMADKAEVTFTDQTLLIPSCFYEFAQRYEMPNGQFYSGFVAASADKIFESTNVAA